MEFQICLHFCVSFLGRKKKQLRDLGEQIYKVKLIITIGEALFSNHCPSPPSYPLCPHFFLFVVILSALPQSERQLILADVQGHISSLTSRCSFNPVSPALCHSARADLVGTDWSNTKEGAKKIVQRTWLLWCFGQGNGHREDGMERNVRSRISRAFSFLFGLFKDYYVLDTVNHLYSHIQEVDLQNFTRG